MKTQISTSVMSEISTEIGLQNVSFDIDAGKTNVSNVSVGEDGLNMTRESQHRTESSCSNSLSVNLPVSFSNHKFLEVSKDGYSFRSLVGGSIDSSNCKAFDCSPDNGLVCKSSVCSDISDNFNCTSQTVENIRSWDEHDNLPTPRSGERTMNRAISGECENVGKNASLESSITKNGDFSMKDEDTYVAEFDLNDDITTNGVDDFIQPVITNVSSHSVVHVVAKTAVPSGRPRFPLKFEGGRYWKGSAKTSAFRRPYLSRNSDKKMCSTNHKQNEPLCCFAGIDLNVAAVEDSLVNGISINSNSTLQNSHMKLDPEKFKNLDIDLNRLYDAGDEFTQLFVPVKLENSPLLDMNVNVNTRKPDFIPISHDCLPDLSAMQHLANNASLLPKLPFLSHSLMGPLHFGSKDRLLSNDHLSRTMPYIGYSHERGILPGLFNPGTVHTSFGSNQLVQVFHEQNTSNIATNLSTGESKMDEARQLPFLVNKPSIGERVNQDDWHSKSMKRKEPEGGLGSYQICYK